MFICIAFRSIVHHIVNLRKSLKCVVSKSLDLLFHNLIATFLTNTVEKSSKAKSHRARVMFRVVDIPIGFINTLENYTLRKYFHLRCDPKVTAIDT
jgi:hypothetical protein